MLSTLPTPGCLPYLTLAVTSLGAAGKHVTQQTQPRTNVHLGRTFKKTLPIPHWCSKLSTSQHLACEVMGKISSRCESFILPSRSQRGKVSKYFVDVRPIRRKLNRVGEAVCHARRWGKSLLERGWISPLTDTSNWPNHPPHCPILIPSILLRYCYYGTPTKHIQAMSYGMS